MSNPWLILKAMYWQKSGCLDTNNGSHRVNAANLALPLSALISLYSHAYHLFVLDSMHQPNGATNPPINTDSRQ
jgi:hypothetical protein